MEQGKQGEQGNKVKRENKGNRKKTRNKGNREEHGNKGKGVTGKKGEQDKQREKG